MRNRPTFLLLASLFASSCASEPARPDISTLAAPALASAASQVKRCYRFPRVGHSGRHIVTTLRVRMTSDGFPDGLPRVVSQHGINPSNSLFADRMAEAAIGAVVRCAPLRLPAELYQGGWDEIELTFSPVASA
jgi:hypothetical protein